MDTLFALLCLAVAVSPATAATLQGLQYAPQGACVVDVGADGRLLLSNIGSSGQDGVSIDCLHMDGTRLALDGECTAADAGSSAELSFSCSWAA